MISDFSLVAPPSMLSPTRPSAQSDLLHLPTFKSTYLPKPISTVSTSQAKLSPNTPRSVSSPTISSKIHLSPQPVSQNSKPQSLFSPTTSNLFPSPTRLPGKVWSPQLDSPTLEPISEIPTTTIITTITDILSMQRRSWLTLIRHGLLPQMSPTSMLSSEMSPIPVIRIRISLSRGLSIGSSDTVGVKASLPLLTAKTRKVVAKTTISRMP